jgi:hypothetical protein
MEQIIDEHVSLARSKQSTHREGPTDEMSPTTKGKRSVVSTKHAPTGTEAAAALAFEAPNPGSLENQPHWPVDDIT